MELAPASLNSYNAFVVRTPPRTSRNFSPPLFHFRPSYRRHLPYFSFKSTVRLQCSNIGATSSNTAAITNYSAKEHITVGVHPIRTDDSGPSTSNEEDQEGKDVTDDRSSDDKMIRICDKLINVFLIDKPTPSDWRRLLTVSKEWSNIRPHFYKRCQDQVDNESDPGMKHKLLRLARKLKEIDDDVQRHNELLDVIKKSPSEVGEIVNRRRRDFTKEFFVHLHTVAESYHDNPTEQNAVAKLGNMCLAAVQVYDTTTKSTEALNAAELKLRDIINSPSVDAAFRKIDNLAKKNELDSTLILVASKSWSASKESNMVKDEVKDVLYHLYMTAIGSLQRLMPKEVRILKYLLTIKDPEERLGALKDAFTPGVELEGKDIDFLYTKPEHLHNLITNVVDAYQFGGEGTLMREARDLMNPKIIPKLKEMRKLIQDNFM